ncbi:hypothetical protein CEXT_612231 [Caerostris extrusa]|uniref:Uncharacterized protein n=1 Tax=Caerostris extrusa TaxID=172846 RepID=A0AAV4P676_CAEEX|nr:hypothetical protein CEXT_612231 [Caerostris extrusa]
MLTVLSTFSWNIPNVHPHRVTSVTSSSSSSPAFTSGTLSSLPTCTPSEYLPEELLQYGVRGTSRHAIVTPDTSEEAIPHWMKCWRSLKGYNHSIRRMYGRLLPVSCDGYFKLHLRKMIENDSRFIDYWNRIELFYFELRIFRNGYQ